MSDPSGTARDDGFMDDPAGSARDDALARHAGVEERGDWLDPLLVAGRDDYVDDDGFTARVMDALPAPAALPAWRKPALVALWGVAGVGLALAAPGAMLDVAREAYRLLATVPVSLTGIASAAVAMIALTGAAAAYTLRASD